MTEEEVLYKFFAVYWDDWVTSGRGNVCVNARTIRVLRTILGESLVDRKLKQWQDEGAIRILGDFEETEPDAACVEVLTYVPED